MGIIIPQIEMNKTRKIKRLLMEHQIERDNYTLVLRLQNTVQHLQSALDRQQQALESASKNHQNTRMEEMEVEIQQLHDENRRMRVIVDEQRGRGKLSGVGSPKKAQQQEPKKTNVSFKCEPKVHELLKENEQLRRTLLGARVNETALKKRKSSVNDRGSMFIERKLVDYERMYQRKAEVEAENALLLEKLGRVEQRATQLAERNAELQALHQRHLATQ